MAQSAIRMASLGKMGLPEIPLEAENDAHVLLCIVFSGPRWNWRMPSEMIPSLSGRLIFTPWLSH
jgi:hypothetical protein